MRRDWKIGICGLAVVALAFLAYTLFGRPPYAFFTLLKCTVAASTLFGGWALFRENRRYLPISFCLVLLGGIHLFARMRRSEWAKFDWAAVVGLLVMTMILLAGLRRGGPTIRQRPQLR